MFRQLWLFGKSGCVPGKVVIIGQKWLYSGKNGCILAKKVVFGQGGCILAKWLFWVKMVVFGQK